MQLLRKAFALAPVERRFAALAWLFAPPASAFVRDGGFKRAIEGLERTAPLAVERANPSISVERGEALVTSAFARQLCTRSCLPQSLVQFVLHRWFGPTPRLVIGVRRDATATFGGGDLDWSLTAHAWVEECDGPTRDIGFVPILSFSDRDGIWRASPNEAQR
jgi:hypothetical protein